MKKKIIGVLAAIIVLLGGGYTVANLGSVRAGDEYQSKHLTSTNASSTAATTLRGSYGTLGSVIVTVPASTGYVEFYNATSGQPTSTATLLTKIDSASDVGGTYQFDLTVINGLKADVPVGFNGEYTVTYR